MKTKYYKKYICIIYFILFSCNNYSNNAYKMLNDSNFTSNFDPIFRKHNRNHFYPVYFDNGIMCDIYKYIDIRNFLYFLNPGFRFYSEEYLKHFLNNIYTQRKKSLSKLLDNDSFLYKNEDIKNIIVDFIVVKNMETLFEQNKKYRNFIYNKISNLEIISRLQYLEKIKEIYLHDDKINFKKFDKERNNLIIDSCDLKTKNCCFRKIFLGSKKRNPFPKNYSYLQNKSLKIEKYRILHLEKNNYKFNLLRLLGVILFLGIIFLIYFGYYLYCNEKIYIYLLLIITAISIFIIPLSLYLVDPAFRSTKKICRKIVSIIPCKKNYEKQKEEILNLSYKTIMDHILCKYHDELYPGLYKPHFLKTHYKKLGNFCLICFDNCCFCLSRSIKGQEIKDMISLEDEEDKASYYGLEDEASYYGLELVEV